MAKYSKKVMGKEVGDASVYAKPHTMSAKTMSEADMRRAVSKDAYGNKGLGIASEINSKTATPGVSIGANTKDNMNGEITMRGYGAATKGIKCRGPMA